MSPVRSRARGSPIDAPRAGALPYATGPWSCSPRPRPASAWPPTPGDPEAPCSTSGTRAPRWPPSRPTWPTSRTRQPRTDPRRASPAWSSPTIADLSTAPADAADAWLRLHLLSHRLVAPRTVNLDGVFGLLTNVAWTTWDRCPSTAHRGALRARGRRRAVAVLGVDKFPRMVDYVVPSGVRIADADRVRLGAHLAAGTTVMHEGFVNFNAGTANGWAPLW